MDEIYIPLNFQSKNSEEKHLRVCFCHYDPKK